MELLYEVKQPVQDFTGPPANTVIDPTEKDNSAFNRFRAKENRPICTVSVKNLLAFTSSNDLSKKNTRLGPLDQISGLRVYAADLNSPWECHPVSSYRSKVTTINWDHTGVRLLIGTNDGLVEIYGMVDNLLNKWALLSFGRFDGEPIITSCWLNAPRKVCLVPDKLDSILYSEKYDISVIANGRGFGGRSMDGAVVVTGTGLVGAILNARQDSHTALTGLEKLLPVRKRVTCTDVSYSKDGQLVVVSSCGDIKQPILMKSVSVTYAPCRDRVVVEVQSALSFFLQNVTDGEVTAVKFVNKMNSEGVLVAVTNDETKTSTLYLYDLVSEEVTLKSKVPASTPAQSPPKALVQQKWQLTHQTPFTSSIEEFCTLPVPIDLKTTAQPQNVNVSMSAVMQPLIAVSLANCCVHLIRCDTFQQVGVSSSVGVNIKREREDGPPEPKQARMSPTLTTGAVVPGPTATATCFVCLQFTWSGCLLVAMDEKSQVQLFKIHPNIDPGTAASLIELSMMGGLDPWDVMMCLRSNMIDNITDRLSEAFARQPPPVQNRFNARILVIKAALFRLASGGVARTNDQQTLLMLHLVSGALKALLRPSDLSSHDKGPAESLASLLSSKGEALSDVDKVLLHVEAKEYTVEPSLLQSLQQFLQWCADLALKLLATLPDLRHSKILGWEVCRDSRAIGTLRELIVLMRIWGLIRSSCLPIFRKTSENLDVLPLLFRHLTRLSVSPHDPDEALIDHNVLLENKPIPELQQITPTINRGFYLWLYIALGFGGVVFVLIILALYCNQCRNKEDETSRSNVFFHQNAAKDEKSKSLSLFDTASMTASSVQPKSQMQYGDTPGYPPNYAVPGKGMQFGSYSNFHPQQPAPNFEQQQDAFLSTLHDGNKIKNTSGGGGRESMSIGRADSVQSILARKDSYLAVYEQYGENEKTPLQLRVDEQNRQSSAYYSLMMQEELRRLDSIPIPDAES